MRSVRFKNVYLFCSLPLIVAALFFWNTPSHATELQQCHLLFQSLKNAPVDSAESISRLAVAASKLPPEVGKFAQQLAQAPETVKVYSLPFYELGRLLNEHGGDQIGADTAKQLTLLAKKEADKPQPKTQPKAKWKYPPHLLLDTGISLASTHAACALLGELLNRQVDFVLPTLYSGIVLTYIRLVRALSEVKPEKEQPLVHVERSQIWAHTFVKKIYWEHNMGQPGFWNVRGIPETNGPVMDYSFFSEPGQHGSTYYLIETDISQLGKILFEKRPPSTKIAHNSVEPIEIVNPQSQLQGPGKKKKKKTSAQPLGPSEIRPETSPASTKNSDTLPAYAKATGKFPIELDDGTTVWRKDEYLGPFLITGDAGGAAWSQFKPNVESVVRTLLNTPDIATLKKSMNIRLYSSPQTFAGFFGIDVNQKFRLLFKWDTQRNRPTDLTVQDYHGD